MDNTKFQTKESLIYEEAIKIKPSYKIIKIYRKQRNNDRKFDWMLRVQCGKSHNSYDVLWSNFKKAGCPQCAREKERTRKYTKEKVMEILKNNNFEMLEDNYVDASTSLKVKCLICGHIAFKNIKNILDGRGCKGCKGLKRKTTDKFKKEVFDLVGEEYKVLGKYITANDSILMKHMICGAEWFITPHNFLGNVSCDGRRCPKCKSSKGEKEIERILTLRNIKFAPQYTHLNCINPITNTKLRFDFAILDKNDKVKYLIEYQGEGHYKPIDWAGKGEEWGLNNLNEYKERDEIKRKYCKSNNIKLIEIPYWEFKSIEIILNKEGII